MSVTVLPALSKKLAETELFTDVPSQGLAEALASARIRHLDKSATIFVQGALAERCHFLLEGRVRILQTDQHGTQVVMRFIGPGEMFGTIGMFTDHRYPAHAVAVSDSMEISWTEAALLELIARYPRIALNLVRIIGGRLRETQDRLREVATQPVEQRIANALLRLAVQTDDKSMAINFPLSRKDIAEICGTTLHTVSRILTAWEKSSAIATTKQRITIHDLAALRRRAIDPPT